MGGKNEWTEEYDSEESAEGFTTATGRSWAERITTASPYVIFLWVPCRYIHILLLYKQYVRNNVSVLPVDHINNTILSGTWNRSDCYHTTHRITFRDRSITCVYPYPDIPAPITVLFCKHGTIRASLTSGPNNPHILLFLLSH